MCYQGHPTKQGGGNYMGMKQGKGCVGFWEGVVEDKNLINR